MCQSDTSQARADDRHAQRARAKLLTRQGQIQPTFRRRNARILQVESPLFKTPTSRNSHFQIASCKPEPESDVLGDVLEGGLTVVLNGVCERCFGDVD